MNKTAINDPLFVYRNNFAINRIDRPARARISAVGRSHRDAAEEGKFRVKTLVAPPGR